MTIRQSHTVTGYNPAVGVIQINTTRTTSSNNHAFRLNSDNFAVLYVIAQNTEQLAIFNQQIQSEMLI